MKYNWQHPDWPELTFQPEAGHKAIEQYKVDAAKLSGCVSTLKKTDQYAAYIELMVSEAFSTSAIEGERLNLASVRSSLKNFLGLTVPPVRVSDPKAEGIAALMVDVGRSVLSPLTNDLLCKWHTMAPPSGEIPHQPLIGQYRNSPEPMLITSGPIGYEIEHFKAPPAAQVAHEMERFLSWYNDSAPEIGQPDKIPSPIRAGIAHLWFESIHPFDNGNGRVGRAIAEHALGQSIHQPPLLSLSSAVQLDCHAYYQNLQNASRADMDITQWVDYFAGIVASAQVQASEEVSFVIGKVMFWQLHDTTSLNKRQEKLINKMFEAGVAGFKEGINNRKFQNLNGCSKATATRDLTDLQQKGILANLPGAGRNTRYELVVPKTSLVQI
jgi:Fic family protein